MQSEVTCIKLQNQFICALTVNEKILYQCDFNIDLVIYIDVNFNLLRRGLITIV